MDPAVRAPAWGVPVLVWRVPDKAPLAVVPCIPPAPLQGVPAVQGSVPEWELAPDSARVQDSASAPAWAAQAWGRRLRVKPRVRHVPVRVAAVARVTRRPRKAR